MNRRILVPILLDLTGSRILFVGAGEGTRTKLSAMASQNPLIRIVAPRVNPEVTALAGTLADAEIFIKPFEESDLEGISLVYGFTDDPEVNAMVADLCKTRGLWHNVAHHRGALSFTNPAVARKDRIVASFSSESGDPAKAVKARNDWVGDR